jgi:hypothetical protein
MEFTTKLLQISSLKLKFDFAPQEVWVTSIITVRDSTDSLKKHIRLIDTLVLKEIRFRRFNMSVVTNLRLLFFMSIVARSRGSIIIIVGVGFWGLLFFHFLFSGSFLLEIRLPSAGLLQLGFEQVIPLSFSLGYLFKRLIVFIKEKLGELRQVTTIFELCSSYLTSVSKISILV